jgi:hypothetical protein
VFDKIDGELLGRNLNSVTPGDWFLFQVNTMRGKEPNGSCHEQETTKNITSMNAACVIRGPTTGFRHFTYRFACYIIFPESPKADGKIRALQSLKNQIAKWKFYSSELAAQRVAIRCDDGAIRIYVVQRKARNITDPFYELKEKI